MTERLKYSLTCAVLFLTIYITMMYQFAMEQDLVTMRNSIREVWTKNYDQYPRKSIINTLRSFPWSNYEPRIESQNETTFKHFSSQLLSELLPFFIMPPNVKVNQTCKRPPPKFPVHLPICNPHRRSRKVGILIQFGFEADILEIHMHELEDIVDYFFILESTRAQFLGIQKPLIWEEIKHQERFQSFWNKTVHFVLDDSDTLFESVQSSASKLDNGKRFGIEGFQEKSRWLKFLEWNTITKHFDADDILGFGDVDEIPSRDVIFYLKNCESPSDPVDIGIWFPFGNINQAFQTDWPVRSHPYTLGDPTFWTLKAALNISPSHPSRKRGNSAGYLLGGMHMTHYNYFPVRLADFFTASESNANIFLNYMVPKLQNLTTNSLRILEKELSNVSTALQSRIITIDLFYMLLPEEYRQIVYLPWFYNCSRKRYPVWEGKHDTRLD